MKSPDPLDPVRLEVVAAQTAVSEGGDEIQVHLVIRYEPWEPSRAQDVLREQARAFDCVREALERGGVGEGW